MRLTQTHEIPQLPFELTLEQMEDKDAAWLYMFLEGHRTIFSRQRDSIARRCQSYDDTVNYVRRQNARKKIFSVIYGTTSVGVAEVARTDYGDSRTVRIGCWIDQAYVSQGIGTVAVHRLVHDIVPTMQPVGTIIADAAEKNIAARRTLELSGFQQDRCEGKRIYYVRPAH